MNEPSCVLYSSPNWKKNIRADRTATMTSPESRCLPMFLRGPQSVLIWGYLCLTAVVIQWVTSGFVAQYVFSDLSYRCTITQTVYTVFFYTVLLIPHILRKKPSSDAASHETTPYDFLLSHKAKVFVLGSLWLCGQVVYVMSLMYTSMGTNTAVSSSSSAFSFIFSMLILGYAFRWLSGLGVPVTIAGVVLTALFRADGPSDPAESAPIVETVEGILMAVSAAGCFGLFSCLFKKWIVNDQYGGIVFGSFGLVAFAVGLPFIVIAHFSGLQTFVVPDWKVWLIVTGDAIMCCFVNNVCLSRAFIYLTPVTVLVGLTITVPLSVFADAVIFANHSYSAANIVGISLITVAVLVVGYDQAIFEKSLDQAKSSPVVIDTKEDTVAAGPGSVASTQ